MENKLLIRTEAQQNEYADFGEILAGIKSDTILKYFLVVNDEEIEIPSTMAFGMAAFFDEYNTKVCKISGDQE